MKRSRTYVSATIFGIAGLVGVVVAGACGGSDGAVGASIPDGGGSVDEASSVFDATTDSAPVGPQTVTFTYTPQWAGVGSVEVVGGFGQPSDWSKTASLLTLTNDGSGKFTGSTTLPVGTYLYVFRVTGDAKAADPVKYQRYAVDPLETAFAPCPAESPTYSKMDVNPCSSLTLPEGPAATPVHVHGHALVDGAAATGWLVELERAEPSSHHYFANRVTVGVDGSFDLVGTAGSYRLLVLLPTFLEEDDIQRDPIALKTVRRAISSAFPLATSDVTVDPPELGFHDYAAFAPKGDATLPTTFAFESRAAHLDVYGGPGDGGVVEVGDPWFSSALARDGGASFDGAFTTKQADQDAAVLGTRYMWGTEEPVDAGIGWTRQTLVFPITWH